MSKQSHHAGAKFSKSHTTVIPAAQDLVQLLARQLEVTKIALGFIKMGLSPGKGQCRVKVRRAEYNSIILTVRGNASTQEIRVFSDDREKTIAMLLAEESHHGLIVTVAG